MTDRRIAAALAAVAAFACPATAQVGDLAGDWDGMVAIRAGLTLPVILHLKDDGATLESPEQGKALVPVTVSRAGAVLIVAMPAGRGRFTLTPSADGRTMGGDLAQGGTAMPVHLLRRAAGAAAPADDRPQTPVPPFPYRAEEVRFPAKDGVRLAGTLTRPAGGDAAPAVILIAGTGPQGRDELVAGHRPFLLLADRLTRAGIAVLRYDKRGVGGSGGTFAAATQNDFTADAASALAWLRGQPGIDPAHIGLIGHSEGAEIAPEVARGPGVAFVVLLAPPGLDGGAVLLSQKRAIETAMGLPPAAVEASVETERRMLAVIRAGGDPAGIRAKLLAILMSRGVNAAQAAALADDGASAQMRAFVVHDPVPALKALRQPALIVQGGRDMQVIPADNLPPIRTALAGKPDVTIAAPDGLNHLLQPAQTGALAEYRTIPVTIDEGALTLIVDWVKAHAGAGETK